MSHKNSSSILSGTADSETRAVIIAANPYGGSARIRRRVDRFAERLRVQGLEPRVIWDAAERTEVLNDPELSRWCRCVVAAGGDGTVFAVVNERPSVPLATLALGNENLFAREFGFTAEAESLAQAIARGQHRTIDLGRGGGHWFSLMVSAGFDADVAHRVAQWRQRTSGTRRVGRLFYAAPLLTSAIRYPYHPMTLEADGVSISGTLILVFNLSQYGFQFKFAPEARGDDGLLDWVVFEHPGRIQLTAYAWSIFWCRHLARPDVHHGRAARVRITSDRPVPVQMDGDPVGHTPIDVEVVPQSLKVLIV